MNKESENRVRELMEDDLRHIDANTRNELQVARYRALSGIHSTPTSSAPAWHSPTPARLVSATIMGCALILVIGLWQAPNENDVQTLMSEIPITPDLSVAELEIVEDLEFYEWLEAGGYAG